MAYAACFDEVRWNCRFETSRKTYPNGVQALKDVTLDHSGGHVRAARARTAPASRRSCAPSPRCRSRTTAAITPRRHRRPAAEGRRAQDARLPAAGVRRLSRRSAPKSLLDHFALLKGIGERRARREVVEALLQQTNLWDVRKQKLGGYSGGMRQRFGVAVALLGNPKLIIVDEPTAGLDPAERVRFLNLLSELGENSVVILSTHIVEDVSELCTRMAIIDRGEILLEAEPLRAVAELRGRIWRRVISTATSSPALEREHAVISTKLLAGRTVVRVYSDTPPGPGFEAAEPDLRGRLLQHDGRTHRSSARAPEAAIHGSFWRIFRFEFAISFADPGPADLPALLVVIAVLFVRDELSSPTRSTRTSSSTRHSPSRAPRSSAACSGCWWRRCHRRRGRRARRGDSDVSAHLHDAGQQGRTISAGDSSRRSRSTRCCSRRCSWA